MASRERWIIMGKPYVLHCRVHTNFVNMLCSFPCHFGEKLNKFVTATTDEIIAITLRVCDEHVQYMTVYTAVWVTGQSHHSPSWQHTQQQCCTRDRASLSSSSRTARPLWRWLRPQLRNNTRETPKIPCGCPALSGQSLTIVCLMCHRQKNISHFGYGSVLGGGSYVVLYYLRCLHSFIVLCRQMRLQNHITVIPSVRWHHSGVFSGVTFCFSRETANSC